MKTYFSELIPRIQRFSKKLDDLTMLTNQHWVVINEIQNYKILYIFKKDNQLLISNNGQVEKGKWEYLGNNSLLIDRASQSHLFKHGFFDENVLALKIDGKEEYAFLVNENKFEGQLNTADSIFEFLTEKYLRPINHNSAKFSEKFDSSKLKYPVTKVYINLNDGRVMTIYSTSNRTDKYNIGDNVSIDGSVPEDGNYHYGWTGCVTIEKGLVKY